VEASAPLSTATLRVTVLGSSSSIPRPGRACSGYLVEGGGSAIATDLGTGALSNLRRVLPSERLDAVVISHMHADHFIDLIPMRYELKYGPRTTARRVKLYLPPGGEAMLRRMVEAFARESRHDFLAEVFEVHTFDPEAALQIGETTVRFARTVHFIPTFATRYEVDRSALCYSSDAAPDSALTELARDANLFLCESTLLPNEVEPAERGHMSAAEAGLIAHNASVERLVLTHYPTETTPAELHSEAESRFDGPIAVADDLDRLEIE
jgi:ribonuclease BN (tRNA processing enzyme)